MISSRLIAGVSLVLVLSSAWGANELWGQDADVDKAVADLGGMKASTPPAEVYAKWNRFCLAVFPASVTPEVYDLYGKDLAFMPVGDWVYPSRSSAAVAWETNLPAVAYVEYGQTAQYGQKTTSDERPFFVHLAQISGLKPDTTYHYRIVAADVRGQKVVSPDRTFTTKTPDGAVLFPAEGQAGPPYVLDKANTTYVLAKDFTADGKGIEIAADGITLDLDGHTVTYHNKELDDSIFTNPWTSHETLGAPGLRNFGHGDFTLLNGTFKQGAGNNAGNQESTGFIPVYVRGCANVRIEGVTVNYHSPQNTGMRLRSVTGPAEVAHCVFLDRGCKIKNRHGAAVHALSLLAPKDAKDYHVHHNLVKRTRQMGMLGAGKLDHNEVYVDSWSVNSFALACAKDDGEASFNRVFGTGVNVQGFGWGEKNCKYTDNFIHLEGIDTGKNRNKEGWGDQDSMNGLRVTNYGEGGQVRDHLLYDHNAVVIRCRGGSQARGTEFFSDDTITNLVLQNSVIRVEAADDQTSRVACVVTHGNPKKADTCLPVWYKNCKLISNVCNVRFGDYYGKGSNHHFVDCTLLRTGKRDDYHTFITDGLYWSKRHVLLDCTFGPGTDPLDVEWFKTGNKSFYSIAWTLTLKAPAGAKVTAKDAAGEVAFTGTVGDDGKLAIPLIQCTVRPPKKLKCPSTDKRIETRTPYTLTVEKDGKTATKTVEMTQPTAVDIAP